MRRAKQIDFLFGFAPQPPIYILTRIVVIDGLPQANTIVLCVYHCVHLAATGEHIVCADQVSECVRARAFIGLTNGASLAVGRPATHACQLLGASLGERAGARRHCLLRKHFSAEWKMQKAERLAIYLKAAVHVEALKRLDAESPTSVKEPSEPSIVCVDVATPTSVAEASVSSDVCVDAASPASVADAPEPCIACSDPASFFCMALL